METHKRGTAEKRQSSQSAVDRCNERRAVEEAVRSEWRDELTCHPSLRSDQESNAEVLSASEDEGAEEEETEAQLLSSRWQ
jgi:hypothetical protein